MLLVVGCWLLNSVQGQYQGTRYAKATGDCVNVCDVECRFGFGSTKKSDSSHRVTLYYWYSTQYMYLLRSTPYSSPSTVLTRYFYGSIPTTVVLVGTTVRMYLVQTVLDRTDNDIDIDNRVTPFCSIVHT